MRKFLVLLMCATLLSGCTKSNIVSPNLETKVADPDFEIKEGISIDWNQVSEEATEQFKNKSDYPYSEDFHFMLQPNSREIMLVWVVSDDLPGEELDVYLETLIKRFNDIAAEQDFAIEKSDDDSYGGLWKDYAVSYGIAPLSTQDDEETWFASGSYGAGVDFVLPKSYETYKKAEQAEKEGSSASTEQDMGETDAAEETQAE